MVRAIPNWAQLTGPVREIRDRGGGRSDVVVGVERADDVAGFPNLLARSTGHDLAVTVPTEAVERLGLRAGDAVSLRAQRAGPHSVVAQPASLARAG